jgi:3D (Asp-Asp-Asp) domain-containing protein
MFLILVVLLLFIPNAQTALVQPTSVQAAQLFRIKVTAYRSVPEQCDASPFTTSIGHRTSQEGLAVSPDLLARRIACYGDVVVVPGIGTRIVNDVMNKRHKNSMDVWVATLSDEKRMGVRRADVTVIKSPYRYCRKGD